MNSVTVVIPTFNRAGLLGRCIQAALDQTVPCEVVVCDHGSTDDTPAVARAFGDRIRYLRREVDSGIHFAWLDGVMGAKGEFVHINFDDDLVRPRFVERCLALMAPDVGLCMSQAEVQDASTGRTVEILFGEIGETGVWPMQRLMATVCSSPAASSGTCRCCRKRRTIRCGIFPRLHWRRVRPPCSSCIRRYR